ncbi:MAG: TolC family protein, partial [Bacteroidota bacterium]
LMQQSKLEMKKIDNQMEMLRNSVALEVKNAQANLLNAYTNLESYEQNAELARKVFKVSEIKYKEGVGSSLEVNEAETQLKLAESAYLSGLFEYLMAQVELDKVKGMFSRYSTPNE